MKKVIAAAFVALCVVASFSTVKAQSPDGQFGVGVALGTEGAVSGAQIQYAISPAFHIGSLVGISVADGNTAIGIAPYIKFIFAGSKEFKPYAKAEFVLMNSSVDLGPDTQSSTRTSMNLGFGGEYFVTPNVGIFGGVSVIMIPFEKDELPLVIARKVTFGILMPQVGIEWFM